MCITESFFYLKLIEIETDNHTAHVSYDRVRDMYHLTLRCAAKKKNHVPSLNR